MKSSNASFARALRALRKERRISQEALAFDAGLDRTYISLLELGRRSPTLETMLAIAHALGISLTELAAATEAAMQASRD
ncbi:helix-turn-helix domain-containing protein [Burkholderia contaminans]|uniref:helix-turn-helix domain-containing protein n=1 Tax=Burkholderia contaminans TaxID=488447 RepID=UPI001CF18F22|nr:helix-turn-helix transcriptional regulator [Burkholderia contaminans]MCA7889714.1 helix-turn-helix domain-containing protein [Burkholderia contaminans]